MRVLCINDDFSNVRENSMKFVKERPIQMEEYTVREVVKSKGHDGYLLEEIHGGNLPSGKEISWDHTRFINITEIDTLEEITKEECLINLQ